MRLKLSQKVTGGVLSGAIQRGLTLTIPFLIIGSFALLINNFPIDAFQTFIKESFFDGIISQFLITIYSVTLDSLALLLILTISVSYGQMIGSELYFLYPVFSLISFMAFCGGLTDYESSIFNATWIFTAMVVTIIACKYFHFFEKRRIKNFPLYSTGAGYYYNLAITYILPLLAIICTLALLGFILRNLTGDANVNNFGSYIFVRVFRNIGATLPGVILYVVLVHILWFFGIHGTNTLEAVAIDLFGPSFEINEALIAAGKAPTEIFNRIFLDSFVFLGGCGTALAFVIALLLVSKKNHNRRLGVFSLSTTLFNISEIPIFGFPIVFSPTMFIPFVLTPVVLTLTSYVAMVTGLVPIPTEAVGWTVPLILSGYMSTKSFSGALLQLFNLVIGIAIYIPFIKITENAQVDSYKDIVKKLEQDVFDSEANNSALKLLSNTYKYSYYAKTLAEDLRVGLMKGEPVLFYQPQITNTGTLHGVEGLLRWKHPSFGYIAPPLLVALASESGFLDELTFYLMGKANQDGAKMVEKMGQEVYISLNISPEHMESQAFLAHANHLMLNAKEVGIHPVLEFTERTVMTAGEEQLNVIKDMQKQGNEFSIDDFGMGHSSILRLQEQSFDEVKLDGSLVTQLVDNPRSQEIVASIVQLARTLDFRIIAEFVETKDVRDLLEELGCYVYQGYYFSRPLPINELLDYLTIFSANRRKADS
ncbi:EAL domain-containing protein [Lachnospiraceae bacterium OttesenSCG-928-J05]|nr:EAL domain-containing protein [Lachnospiraceae bacterium OttesenSCG-928-J05]